MIPMASEHTSQIAVSESRPAVSHFNFLRLSFMDLQQTLNGSDSLRSYESIAALNQVRGDAHGDLARLVRAQGQADGAVKLLGRFGCDAAIDQLTHQDLSFRMAADDAQVAWLQIPLQNRLQNRPICLMTHCHAQNIVVGAKLRHEVSRL